MVGTVLAPIKIFVASKIAQTLKLERTLWYNSRKLHIQEMRYIMSLRIEGIAGGANSLPRVSRSPGLYAQLIYKGYGISMQEEIALKIEFFL
jgi:hypothetical protein